MLDRSLFARLSALTLCVVLVAAAGNAETPHTDPLEDVVAFCRMHGTLDYPERTFFGASYQDGFLPKPVQDTWATDWRCLDGEVLVCMNSADGDWCSKKDPSHKPSSDIQEFCAENSGSDYVTKAAEVYSASTWRCIGRKPVVLETWTLDKRGFMQKMWLRLVIRNGVAVEPHPDDFGMR
jgi:hypothetical protein